eukprot:TRINITY_DN4581_c0_g2_i1.p1 TRINITY_DN4581_c0_g2~~TRINITY_DN4581_c0_g2_i1.p1  ORF type:complete len:259 (+),score=30.83 TRINITY_DN4581_c0_g2_i1:123-899(+)
MTLIGIVCLLVFLPAILSQDICTTTDLNIRTGPGTSYPILWTAATGASFKKIAETSGWYQVKADGGSHNGEVGYGSGTYFTACATGGTYNSTLALEYSAMYWLNPNHNCASAYDACSPWSCWGIYCGYPSHGGDCANFVSQCLINGHHPPLNQGFPCRGYPCGKEEVGAKNLGDCLANVHHWKRTCGLYQNPPATIKLGDVLIYHESSCADLDAHATIVTQIVSPTDVRISCHSPSLKNQIYTQVTSKRYYEWLEYVG